MIKSYYNDLKALFIKNGYNMQATAKALNINICTLLIKLKSGEFKVSELQKLISIFGKEEIDKIFFT